jgi:predicted Ser/Thr protein kinase
MNKSNLQTYDKPIELGKSLDGHRSRRAFRISDEYVAKLGVGKETVSNQKLLDYKYYGNILHEFKVAKLLYTNGISIPKPITCDYVNINGKLQMGFIMEYIEGISFDETKNKELLELAKKMVLKEEKKIEKLNLFSNFTGPQWILTNKNEIKLIDFEKWGMQNDDL